MIPSPQTRLLDFLVAGLVFYCHLLTPDVCLLKQGNKHEELPEQILCCVRLSGIDYMSYHQLGITQEPSDLSAEML